MQGTARSRESSSKHIVRVGRYGLTRCPTCAMFIRVAGADHETTCACCGVQLEVQLVTR